MFLTIAASKYSGPSSWRSIHPRRHYSSFATGIAMGSMLNDSDQSSQCCRNSILKRIPQFKDNKLQITLNCDQMIEIDSNLIFGYSVEYRWRICNRSYLQMTIHYMPSSDMKKTWLSRVLNSKSAILLMEKTQNDTFLEALYTIRPDLK